MTLTGDTNILSNVATSDAGTHSVLFAPSLPATVWERMLDVGTQPSNRLETVPDPVAPVQQRFYRVVTPKLP